MVMPSTDASDWLLRLPENRRVAVELAAVTIPGFWPTKSHSERWFSGRSLISLSGLGIADARLLGFDQGCRPGTSTVASGLRVITWNAPRNW